jgi:5-methylcytosine-specific restriction enzyme subunit McrC
LRRDWKSSWTKSGQNAEKNPYFDQEQADKVENQQFIQFLHKTNQIKSNNYVGVIHFEGHRINLLPKVFFKPVKNTVRQISKISSTIFLWWLSYCRKVRFPNYQAALESTKVISSKS